MLGLLCLAAPVTCPRAVGPERLRQQCAQTADGYCICAYFAMLNTLLPYLVLHPLLVGDLSPDFLKSSVAHMALRMVNIFFQERQKPMMHVRRQDEAHTV